MTTKPSEPKCENCGSVVCQNLYGCRLLNRKTDSSDKPECSCHLHERQVCDICQNWTGNHPDSPTESVATKLWDDRSAIELERDALTAKLQVAREGLDLVSVDVEAEPHEWEYFYRLNTKAARNALKRMGE